MRTRSKTAAVGVVMGLAFALVLAVVPGRTATATLVPGAMLRLDTGRLGKDFPVGAVGLSIESRELGTNHLATDRGRLARLMRLLGPSVLRIGGDSVDTSWWTSNGEPPPSWATNTVTPSDLTVLRGLLAATGWRALLGVDLGHFEPARAADEARYARQILGGSLVGVEIGNEPDDFSGVKAGLRASGYSVEEYFHEAQAYSQAIGTSAPGTAIYGPALGGERWLTKMGAAIGLFSGITQHYYPTSTCPNVPASERQATAAGLLSATVRTGEDEVLTTLAQVARAAHRSIRIGETNGVSCTASPSASQAFATALWALDWTLRAAHSGVTAINFHSNLRPCGPYNQSPICVPGGDAETAGALSAESEYYGLLAAVRLEGGRFVPTTLITSTPALNLVTWATASAGGKVTIALENLATTGPARTVAIPTSRYTPLVESLVAPSLSAKSGVTLAGARVTSTGLWRAKPTHPHAQRVLGVIVAPASAIIVTLYPKPRSRG